MKPPATRPDVRALGRLALGTTIIAITQHVLGTIAFVLVALLLEVMDPGGHHNWGGGSCARVLVGPLSALAFVLCGLFAGALMREWSRLGPRWRTIIAVAVTSTIVFSAVMLSEPIDEPWLLASILSVAAANVIATAVEYT